MPPPRYARLADGEGGQEKAEAAEEAVNNEF
jgi:hypothetical protein